MKSIIKRAGLLAAFLVGIGGSAHAATVEVRVPFPFLVHGKIMPAGDWRSVCLILLGMPTRKASSSWFSSNLRTPRSLARALRSTRGRVLQSANLERDSRSMRREHALGHARSSRGR